MSPKGQQKAVKITANMRKHTWREVGEVITMELP